MKPNAEQTATTTSTDKLRRNLNNRHIQLMALGGTIGTGLFMGSGKSISTAGPSIIFTYILIGFMLFFVMRAMGEILLSNLNYNSFSDFAADILGPWAGFFTGWTYWFCWVVTIVAEIVAISSYLQFWFPQFSILSTAILCVCLFLILNIVTVKLFGEMEFWFAIIKIISVLALIICGIILVFLNYTGANGIPASLSNLWRFGGFFPTGINGFFAGFQIAIFAFVGIELVGTAAAETRNPLYTLPKAINSIPIRIILFYVLALVIIMTVTPWTEVNATQSPFVRMFVIVGLPAAASIVNFVILTSAASSANSGIFSTSRMLYGMAEQGVAHQDFARLSRRAVPVRALLFSCLCLLVSSALLYFNPDVMTAFTLVTTLSALLFIFIWSMILCCYLVYLKKYPERHRLSPFKMPAGKFMCWVVLAFFLFVLVLLALNAETRQGLLVTPIWFILLAIGWSVQRRKLKNK
jgi:D-serine/D-alanine/glycine transporter